MDNNAPLVSVLMPSLNVGPYIEECLGSVVNQTLKNIEIICIDAGSTDGTYEKLQAFAQKDARIQIIHSDRRSYGYQMNLGLDAAHGDYIGIVETDDFVEPDMFERLSKKAIETRADMVRANYYWYYTKPSVQNTPYENLALQKYNTLICPRENIKLFETTPAIWSGIYKRDFLQKSGIRFNETPGASYQDTSFFFMVCSCADTAWLMNDYLLHYRKDNDSSSVNNPGKIYCIPDEMHYYEAFLERNPQVRAEMEKKYQALKYEKYRWNFDRLAPQYQFEFFRLMFKEFSEAGQRGVIEPACFEEEEARPAVDRLIHAPLRYYEEHCKVFKTRGSYSAVSPAHDLVKSKVAAPNISVIIPVYNAEPYLRDTLNSLLNPILLNIEIICVNDGSTDGSLQILKEYSEKYECISVITQTNKGQAVARNEALHRAKGNYIYFLDSDDMVDPAVLQTMADRATAAQLDVIYFNGRTFFETEELKEQFRNYIDAYEDHIVTEGPVSGKELFCILMKEGKYRQSVCMCLIRRGYIQDHELFFEEGIFYEDNVYAFRLMLEAKRAEKTENIVLIRRMRQGSTVTSKKTFTHFYGYLASSMTLNSLLSQSAYENPDLDMYTTRELERINRSIYYVYQDQTDKEKKKMLERLTEFEKLYFMSYILAQWQSPKKNRLAEWLTKTTTRLAEKTGFVIARMKKQGIRSSLRFYIKKYIEK